MTATRISKSLFVASVALFFSLIAFGNITDYQANFAFVSHVLSMDTLANDRILWRAITKESWHHTAYIFIIAWQVITAILCWIGVIKMLQNINADKHTFQQNKSSAILGLTLGFLLYMVGFLIIGAEWFSMWQSSQWDAQSTAGLFALLIAVTLIYVSAADI
jgi:predicted small integral membrane protein